MLSQDVTPPAPTDGLSPLRAAEVQDDLLTTHGDLDRLQRLLGSASDSLLGHFHGASRELHAVIGAQAAPGAQGDSLRAALDHLAGAITALQFQDMACQLIDHSARRLRRCADRLACEVFGDDEDGAGVVEAASLRPNPVTQDEVDAGSIELF